MAQLHNFDATTVSSTIPFEPVPAGKYQVAITASTAKPTRSNHGAMLELTFTILEGAYRNRRVWDYLCIQHPNSQVSSIARANLSAICHAVGILRPQDTMELHNNPLCIQVGPKKDTQSDTFRNTVRGYMRAEEEPSPIPSRIQNISTDHVDMPKHSEETTAPWGA